MLILGHFLLLSIQNVYDILTLNSLTNTVFTIVEARKCNECDYVIKQTAKWAPGHEVRVREVRASNPSIFFPPPFFLREKCFLICNIMFF